MTGKETLIHLKSISNDGEKSDEEIMKEIEQGVEAEKERLEKQKKSSGEPSK